MSNLTRAMMMGAAGASGDKVYVDDVLSTSLYDGNDANRSINNGIDLAGEGGLVWIKSRTGGMANMLFDTERGVHKFLESNATNAEASYSASLTAFNSNGFSLFDHPRVNSSSYTYASWTFRKQKGFFDVVTWTGDDQNDRAISHSLGSEPGMVIVKRTNGANNWFTYHRSLASPLTKWVSLNQDAAETQANVGTNMWGSMTSTHIGIRNYFGLNALGGTFVAYIFAHDDAQFGTGGDESIIKCGSYTGGGSSETTVDLGFEPQWVIIKRTSASADWALYDNMRGVATSASSGDMELRPNQTSAETNENRIDFYAQGFKLQNDAAPTNGSGSTYIYMAIRRPHKPPEVATEVFAIDSRNSTSPVAAPTWKAPFPVDFAMHKWAGPENGLEWGIGSRLTPNRVLVSNSNAAESGAGQFSWDWQNGFYEQTGVYSQEVGWMFKRAPGFMDVVAFSGTGSNLAVNHNLAAIPELIIHKNRTSAVGWVVSATPLYSSGKILNLSSNSGPYGGGTSFMTAAPTASQISLSSSSNVINASGNNYIQYLFATLPGISKVGSYSGNTGNAVNVNCGFTNGARFIMIKRIDEDVTGDWYVWDTLRGIVSGNDPYLLLNSSNGQISNTDYIDPLSSGFTVTSSAPAALNASGGTYLFLAIA